VNFNGIQKLAAFPEISKSLAVEKKFLFNQEPTWRECTDACIGYACSATDRRQGFILCHVKVFNLLLHHLYYSP
jgi:hypothetical protein